MLLRKEFTIHNDGFYFLYVTDSVRIETPHHIPTTLLPHEWEYEITIEDKQYNINAIRRPFLSYVTLEEDEAAHFQESTVTGHLEDIIRAAKDLLYTLRTELNYVHTN